MEYFIEILKSFWAFFSFLIFMNFIGAVFIIIIVISSKFIPSLLKSIQSSKANQTYFRIEKEKDKGANSIYSSIELLSDRIVIDNSEYILYSNIEKAYVTSSMQEIKLVNPIIRGGRQYKQGMVYFLQINYRSKQFLFNDGYRSSLSFGSLNKLQFNQYKLIKDKINLKVGYIEIEEEHKIKEL